MPDDETVSVRITRRTHLQLRLLSATLTRPMHDLVAEAVAAHYRPQLDQLCGRTPTAGAARPRKGRA